MSQFIVLRLFKNGELVEVKQFDTEQIVIGRSGDAQLTIDDPSVSPLHAVIENREGKYYISDLGSESGTFINDEKVLEKEIDSGQEAKIGDFSIQFNVGVPKPANGANRGGGSSQLKKVKSPRKKSRRKSSKSRKKKFKKKKWFLQLNNLVRGKSRRKI